MAKIAANTNTADLTKRLTNVNRKIYDKLLNEISKIQVEDENGQTSTMPETTSIIFANYTYLVYEYLELNISREIDYEQVRNFVNKFKDYLAIILEPYFSIDMLRVWLNDDVKIEEMAMYESANNYNKNVYH